MSKKTISIVIGVLVVAAGLLIWVWPFSSKQNVDVPKEVDLLSNIATITANHFFKDGVHTLEGRISLPNPCYSLTHTEQIAESYPEQVTIAFVAKNNGEVCAQVIDEKIFSVSFGASKDAKIRATLNGREVKLDLISGGEVKGAAIEKL